MKQITATLNDFVKTKSGKHIKGQLGIQISFQSTEDHPHTQTVGLTYDAACRLYLQLQDILCGGHK